MKINIENLSFGYDSSFVLKDINLDYDSNDFLAIVGPNGGGKTTLLKMMIGLLEPTKGKITIDNMSPNKVSKQIGYVPQNIPINKVFPMSVLEVVLMGRLDKKIFGFYTKEDKKAAKEALEKVGMSLYCDRGIGELSGGQRQRVYIARAMCSETKVLMFDEPTASIDMGGQADIYRILKQINQNGVGVIIISHDINISIGFANKVAYINGGLFMHNFDLKNDKSEFIDHLSHSHEHFCSVELALRQCGCDLGENNA